MVLNLPLIRTRRPFWRDSRGAVAMLFALSVPVLLGFAGIGIEVGVWLMNVRSMQGVADAAAASAAIALNQTSGSCTQGQTNVCAQEADTVSASNGWRNGAGGVTVTVNNPPRSGNFTTNTNAIEVIIQQPGTNWFSAFLPSGYTTPTIAARSVALANPAVNCMLSLNRTNTAGINFALLFGSINMPRCSIADNALGGNALEITGILTTVNAWTATVAGSINSGFLNQFNFSRSPSQGRGVITPDCTKLPGSCAMPRHDAAPTTFNGSIDAKRNRAALPLQSRHTDHGQSGAASGCRIVLQGDQRHVIRAKYKHQRAELQRRQSLHDHFADFAGRESCDQHYSGG